MESTYQAALRLNQIKHRHGLIGSKEFREIENRIREAKATIEKADKMMTNGGDPQVEVDLTDLKKGTSGLRASTLCGESELKWPVRFFKFSVTKRSFRLLAFLRLGNILWSLLWGGNFRKQAKSLKTSGGGEDV